jgi:hypothetical protein
MNLPEIHTNLLAIITGIASLAGQVVIVNDGAQNTVMEDALKDRGLVIAIENPDGIQVADAARGAVKIDYSTTIWVRTNPKVKVNGVPAWNPLAIEGEIISAVMAWSRPRVHDTGFHLTDTPETDFWDTGNNSRFIRFATRVHFA